MIDRLINKIKEYNDNPDIELITKAFNVASEMHKGQVRNSGEE